MDKQNRNLLIVGAGVLGLIAYSLFRKARTLTNLNFAIKGIDLDIKKKTASVDLRVINPTKGQITINSVVCDVLFQDEAIGTVKYLKDTIIAGQSEVILRMPVTVNPIAIASLVLTILSSKQKSLSFKIKGTASADNILFPVDIDYSYDLAQAKK
jgi:LEA14-like dessication related protein